MHSFATWCSTKLRYVHALAAAATPESLDFDARIPGGPISQRSRVDTCQLARLGHPSAAIFSWPLEPHMDPDIVPKSAHRPQEIGAATFCERPISSQFL